MGILVFRYGTGPSCNLSLWDFCQFIVHQMQNNKSDFLEMQKHTSPQTVRFEVSFMCVAQTVKVKLHIQIYY